MMAIAVNRAFHDAGWAWVKLATGILVFAGSFQVLARYRTKPRKAWVRLRASWTKTRSQRRSESKARCGFFLAVSTANVVLGVWRPRLTRIRIDREKP